jgi:hypothetical protein
VLYIHLRGRPCPLKSLAWFDNQFDCRADIFLDFYIYEFWDGDYINAIPFQVDGGQYQSLDRLIDRSSPDGLDFCLLMFTNNPSDCSSHCGRTGGRRYFDYSHGESPYNGLLLKRAIIPDKIVRLFGLRFKILNWNGLWRWVEEQGAESREQEAGVRDGKEKK